MPHLPHSLCPEALAHVSLAAPSAVIAIPLPVQLYYPGKHSSSYLSGYCYLSLTIRESSHVGGDVSSLCLHHGFDIVSCLYF